MLPAGFCLTRELECTRGISRGQFHNFGAMREKSVTDFHRSQGWKNSGVSRVNSHHHAAFLLEKPIRGESVGLASRNFHTRRTGNAEKWVVIKRLVPGYWFLVSWSSKFRRRHVCRWRSRHVPFHDGQKCRSPRQQKTNDGLVVMPKHFGHDHHRL